MKCQICSKEIAGGPVSMDTHWGEHAIRPVKGKILSYLLVLPDGVTEGRYAAAEAFVDAFAELRQKHPGVQFDFLPFSFANPDEWEKQMALKAVLAIAK